MKKPSEQERLFEAIFNALHDITERKLAEEALRKRTKELGKRIKELNCLHGISNLVEKPGASLEEILQGTVDLIPPSWQYPEVTCARITLDSQEFRTENFRETIWKQTSDISVHGARTGTVEVCYLQERPERDEGPFLKEERRLINAITEQLGNIIEQRRAEQQLRESETKLRTFMDSSVDGFVLLDNNLNIVTFNKAAQILFGWMSKDVLGKNILDITPNLRDTGTYDQYLQVLKTGEPFFADDIVPRPELGDVHLSVEAFKVGEGLGMIASDITKRKQMEQKIREYSQQLEQKVEELQTAYQQLQELDRMKDNFLSTVSHELRTPLTSIKGFAEILLSYEEDTETQREFLGIINEESDRLTRLIDDLLDLSRLEAGRMLWQTTELSIPTVVETAINAVHALYTQKNLTVDVDWERDLPTTWVDRDRFVQVMNNLLSNAIKFTPEGGEIRVGARFLKKGEPEGDSDMIRVSVSDTGIGIAAEDQKKVFDKFRQVGDTLTDKPKGTGLGLPICQEIVEHYGGRIWVESELGKGSTFYFTVPVMEKTEAEVSAVNEERPGKKHTSWKRTTM